MGKKESEDRKVFGSSGTTVDEISPICAATEILANQEFAKPAYKPWHAIANIANINE